MALAYVQIDQYPADEQQHLSVIGSKAVLDSRKVKEWGLDPDILPFDVEIINQTVSFYQQYTYQIWSACALFLILVLGLCISLFYYFRTKRLKDDLLKSEKDLRVAKDRAEESNRLKSAFLANMSHEIRTPLNSIVGFSDVLAVGGNTEEEQQTYYQIIKTNSDLLLRLINDILDLSRLEANRVTLTWEECDVVQLCRQVVASVSVSRQSGNQFLFVSDYESFRMTTDIQRMQQVIINLMSNADKFTRKGQITLEFSVNEETEMAVFSVTDTGCGIPKEKQKLVFERFEKLNEYAQGTGLGLSICQVIATKLKGRITLSSEMNKGSRFNIVLSYADQAGADHLHPDNALTVAEKVSSVNSNLPIVLIAEDSVNNYMVLNNILKKFCTVVWAINGKDALDIVNKQKVDVVLMDIKMYEMDGLTALRKIRKKNKKLPVVIQTAYAFDENRKQAEEAGANGFIAKPIRVEELMGVIGKYIGN